MIKRPVLAIVIAIIIVILGGMSLWELPVEQYPDITPPQVEVSATYTGADATVVSQSVTTPIAQSIMGVENMLYMQSTSANDGTMSINVTFEQGTDPDMNTILTQNQINSVTSLLPTEVIEQGITVSKSNSGFLLVYTLYADEYYDQTFLSNYALINIKNELLKINGVGKVQAMGGGEYAMRVWVNPNMLAYYDVSIDDIVSEIESQSGIFPVGTIGAPPSSSPTQFTYSVILPPQISTPEQYGDIVIKSLSSGAEVKLSDVARVEFGSEDYGLNSLYNGNPAAVIMVYQAPGSNALEVGTKVKAKMEQLKQKFPEGIDYTTTVDTTTVITEGTIEIIYTLLFALLLVVMIIYLFVQDMRAMIIPLVAIPVSLIGAFIFFPLLGFTINVFSLLGMVLAIGLVVDDAIVVIEAVQVGLERGLSPKEATIEAMEFVKAPIIATTLVMAAVFIPVSLMGGITGILYQQFAVTIAVSVLISAFNALTLSPVLCTIWLKDKKVSSKGFFGWFNKLFQSLTNSYIRCVSAIGKRSWIAITMVMAAIISATIYLKILPTGFLPEDDQGYLMSAITLPNASSVARTEDVVAQAAEVLSKNQYIEDISTLAGFDMLSGVTSSSSAIMFLKLKEGKRPTATQLATTLNGELYMTISEGRSYVFGPPPIPALGTASGFSMMLQQYGTPYPQYLEQQLELFLEKANQTPEIEMAYSMYSASIPAKKIEINKNQALTEDVEISSIHTALTTFMGSKYINNLNRFGMLYETYIETDGEYRREVSNLDNYFVKNSTGKESPVSSFVTISDTTNVKYLTGFNLLNSASVMGNAAKGYSSNDALDALKRVADQNLPEDMGYAWSGMSYQDVEAASNQLITYLSALIFIFLVLAALYESWFLPITIILGIPFAMFGALTFISLARIFTPVYSNDIFFQVSLIMLIALSAKNAILIIEYAEKIYIKGGTLLDAAVEASRLRFRPIIMTAIAFIIGISPLIFATGSNAIARNIMGYALVGGMAIATTLGILVYPALYVLIGKIGHFDKRRERMREDLS